MRIFYGIDEHQDTHWTHKIVFDVTETVKIMGPVASFEMRAELDNWIIENTKFRDWTLAATHDRQIVLLVEKRDEFDSFIVEFKLRWL